MKLKELTHFLESQAPLPLQESYDNAGLIVGDPEAEISGVLVSLDATETVLDEAIEKGCNVVVSHHPIVFSGLKSLTGRNYVERTVLKAIKNDVALYAIHTNLDNVRQGVNAKICEMLELENCQILAPKPGSLMKLTVFVPHENRNAVLDAMAGAGAGQIGNYSHCSFQLEGTGTFEPNEAANPHIGKANQLERVGETRIEMVLPSHLEKAVVGAMRAAHPYEEVAFFLHKLENTNPDVGAGMVGTYGAPKETTFFLEFLAGKMGLKTFKHTALVKRSIGKVAVCGGAGSFLLGKAMAAGADIFITSDYKYHQFFDAEDRIIIADIGHYESEVFTKDLLADMLAKLTGLPLVHICRTNTNPVRHYGF